jgi:membrane associated rhomboid family serine protease
MESANREGSVRAELRTIVRILGGFIAVLWAIECVDFIVFAGGLDRFGITPRSVKGAMCLLSAPFLHGGWGHLASNTFGLAVLGGLVLMWGRREFFAVSLASIAVGGLGTWIVGAAGSNHIGASGIVFGYFGYLIGRGIYERRIGSIIIAVIVALSFGGMVGGVVPGLAGPGISWECHLFGALGGLLMARRFRKRS